MSNENLNCSRWGSKRRPAMPSWWDSWKGCQWACSVSVFPRRYLFLSAKPSGFTLWLCFLCFQVSSFHPHHSCASSSSSRTWILPLYKSISPYLASLSFLTSVDENLQFLHTLFLLPFSRKSKSWLNTEIYLLSYLNEMLWRSITPKEFSGMSPSRPTAGNASDEPGRCLGETKVQICLHHSPD